jgi:anti-sigma factor RsiW
MTTERRNLQADETEGGASSTATGCDSIRPLLYRMAESEVNPEEAMRTARHLSDCTACRILLARERRLASLLEQDLEEPLQVGEDFVDSVMSNLPQEPPPAPPRNRKSRRGLKLACLAGLLAMVPVEALRAPLFSPRALLPSLPNFGVDSGAGLLESLGGLVGGALLVIDALVTSMPSVPLPSLGLAAIGIALVIPLLTGLVGAAGILAFATHRLVR